MDPNGNIDLEAIFTAIKVHEQEGDRAAFPRFTTHKYSISAFDACVMKGSAPCTAGMKRFLIVQHLSTSTAPQTNLSSHGS